MDANVAMLGLNILNFIKSYFLIYSIINQYLMHEFYDSEAIVFLFGLFTIPAVVLGVSAFLISTVIRRVVQRNVLSEEK